MDILEKLQQYRSLKLETIETNDKSRLNRCIAICTEVDAFIDSISDSYTRRIFMCKYITGRHRVSWQQVATRIGGGNTKTGVYMRATRYIDQYNTTNKNRLTTGSLWIGYT